MKGHLRVATLAVVLAAGATVAWSSSEQGTDLTGTWRILATIPPGTPVCPGPDDCVYPALATATRDGGLLQTAPISNTLTGHGTWKRMGPRRFLAHTVYFRVNPADGSFVGTSETSIDITVTPGGQDADGTFDAVILGVDGSTITTYSGTVTAERLEVD